MSNNENASIRLKKRMVLLMGLCLLPFLGLSKGESTMMETRSQQQAQSRRIEPESARVQCKTTQLEGVGIQRERAGSERAGIQCEPTESERTASQCQRTELEKAGFSFILPDGMVEVPVNGIDSLVYSFKSPSLELLIDYGPYSDPLKMYPDGAIDVQVQEELIDGKSAKLVTYQVPSTGPGQDPRLPYFAGVYFADLGRGPMYKLGLYANAQNPEAQASAVEMIRSILFLKD